MIDITQAILNEKVKEDLLAMSNRWETEGITFGYRANSVETLKNEDIFLANLGGQTVGYLLCHRYVQEEYSAAIPRGMGCLEIEDLYILPEYRSRGIGQALYQFAVDSYGETVDYVTLSTATKDYRSILHFYIEELGMTFWSARLFKEVPRKK